MNTSGDILEEAEEAEEEGEWVASVARSVGNVVASVSGAIRKASVAFPLRRPPPRKRQGANVEILVRSLCERVSAHGPDDWQSLERDAEFWRLIAQLGRAPRRVRFDRVRDSPRTSVGEVVDTDVEQESQRREKSE